MKVSFPSSGPTEELGGLFRTRTRKLPVPFAITRIANSAGPQTGGINRNPPISVEVSRGIEYTTGGGAF